MQVHLLRCLALNLWKRAPKAPEPPAPPSLLAEVRDLREQLAAVERTVTQLRMEWTDTLDKITSWANRQAARERRKLANALDGSQNDDPPQGVLEMTPPNPQAAKEALRRRAFGGR